MWGDKQPQPQMGTRSQGAAASSATDAVRPAIPTARASAWLGPSVIVKGEISGDEDLQIDGKVEGPVSLGGHRLTIGRTAHMTAELVAREIVVYGKVDGDLRARDRIEIKKDGAVVGDLTTARIVIEDGAYFKGKIEIDRNTTQVGADLQTLLARTTSKPDPELAGSSPFSGKPRE